MKITLLVLAVWLFACQQSHAIKITHFQDTDTFIDRAHDIVVAKCLSVAEGPEGFDDGLYPAEIDVLRVLKGEGKPGRLKVATIYPMKPGIRYLLASMGGMAFDAHFLATAELSVVPIPASFDTATLTGKNVKEQVELVFSRHLYEIEQELASLKKTQAVLEKSLVDRKDDVFEPSGAVQIGQINRVTAKEKDQIRWLPLRTGNLEWSHSEPGRTGFLYFTGANGPAWEFARSPHEDIQQFIGKPLRAKFYGRHSPGLETVGWRGGNSILVTVGQIVLARTVDDPTTVYILKIASQEKDKEKMSVVYAIIGETLE